MQRLMKDVEASNAFWENMGATDTDGPPSPAVDLQASLLTAFTDLNSRK